MSCRNVNFRFYVISKCALGGVHSTFMFMTYQRYGKNDMEYSHRHAFDKVHSRQVTVFSFKRQTDESKTCDYRKKYKKLTYVLTCQSVNWEDSQLKFAHQCKHQLKSEHYKLFNLPIIAVIAHLK